ncbi:MAG TPA: hypothetical protein VGG05_04940, partial [Pseudonocardiaceae bacterium]
SGRCAVGLRPNLDPDTTHRRGHGMPDKTNNGSRTPLDRPRPFRDDLRAHLAPQLGRDPAGMTSAQITYDRRRLRLHGLIERVPHTFRYRVTDTGLRCALFLTRAHTRMIRAELAELTDPEPPMPSRLRSAAHAYQAAINDLATTAGIAA